MQRILKRKLVIALVALATAALAGGAYAATQNSAPNTRQAFLNDVAKRLHVTPQQLSSALNGAFLDQLQAAVKDGRLTQAQANALTQRLKQKNLAAPAVPFGFFGPGMARPWLHRGFGVFGGAAGGLEGAAQYLGLSDAQLFQQLSSGKSLAEIAASRGKSVSGLEQAMTAALKSRLDKLVANKLITAAQETKLLSRWSARLSTQVNQKGLEFRRPALRFRGRGPVPPLPTVPGAAVPAPPLPAVPGSAVRVPYPAPTA